MSIPLRNFGKTGVRMSTLGFGGNHFGAVGVRPFGGSIQLSPHLYLNLLENEHRDRNQHLAHFSHEFSCRLISHFMQAGRQEA